MLMSLPNQDRETGNYQNMSGTKALTYPVIMDRIQRHVPARTLLTIRQVSTAWNARFVSEIRKRNLINVILIDDGKGTKSTKRMDGFMDLLRSSQSPDTAGFPSSSYTLELMECTRHPEFMSKCGKLIKCLTLTHLEDVDQFHLETGLQMPKAPLAPLDLDLLGHIIFEETSNLTELDLQLDFSRLEARGRGVGAVAPKENLKSLSLSYYCQSEASSEFTAMETFLVELIKCAVGLESLEIGGSTEDSDDDGLILLTLLNSVPSLDKLRSLNLLESDLSETVLRKLTKLGQQTLHLESLSVTIERDPDNVTLLRAFLETQSSTLRHLQLNSRKAVYYQDSDDSEGEGNGDDGDHGNVAAHVNVNAPPVILQVPQMTQLQTFAIWYPTMEFTPFPLQFDQGTLSATFPHLKRFEWFHNFATELEHITMELQHIGVTELLIHLQHVSIESPDQNMLTVFGSVFPAVTRLELKLIGEGFAFAPLWTTWRGLQILRVEFRDKGNDLQTEGVDLDSLLSGVGGDGLRGLKRQLDRHGPTVTLDVIQGLLTKYKSQPGISDLKHLREFTILGSPPHGSFKSILTDLGGYFGLAMASPTLQYLRMSPNPDGKWKTQATHEIVKLSADCQALIRTVLGPRAVIELEVN